MGIDIATETVLTLAQAAAHPAVGVTRAQVWRWARRGVKGVRLEYLERPSGKITSLEAIQRFYERLTAARAGRRADVAPARRLSRGHLEAEAYLDAMGA